MMDVSLNDINHVSPTLCHTLGPYKDHMAAKDAFNEITHFGKEASIRTEMIRESAGYWVYLKAASEQESKTYIEALMNKGIDDYYRTGRNQISLGIYNGIQGARKREASMSALGLSPLVEPYYREQAVYWIDVIEMERNKVGDREWAAYLDTYPEGVRNSVECELINA
jgi:hypothetical protein